MYGDEIMEKEKVVFVPCRFERGAFPHERTFVIQLDDGWEYRGTAPLSYCFMDDRRSLSDLPPEGSDAKGRIVGIQIAPSEGGNARVQLPDGEVYELPEDHFQVRSRTGALYVSVES